MRRKITFLNLMIVIALVSFLFAGVALAAGDVQTAAEDYFGGGTKNIAAADIYDNLNDGDASNDPYIIDCRKAEDYEKAHIPGAVNVSAKTLFTEAELAKLPKDKQIVAVCYTGQTASQTTAALRMLGYDAYNMLFGMPSWTLIPDVVRYPFSADQSAGYEVETTANEATETYDLPEPPGDTVAEAAEAYFSGGTKNIKAADLFDNLHDGDESNDPFIVDLRKADDYALGHIPGAVNISVKALFGADTLKKLPPDKQIVTYCYTGQTSSQATAALRMLGYDAYSMLFGMPAWAMVEGLKGPAPFDASKSMGYAVEGTAAAAPAEAPTPTPAPAPAELPVSGGVLVWHEMAAVGLIVIGMLSLTTGAVGFFVSRRRAN
ncbi:MAG TPA: rhodanese-like domain-containing protein [Anaerolineae bacterium]|nr:rhodanese-like domain-containing protein [Anaerolineae bacterium]